jgi:Sigma-70 region 2
VEAESSHVPETRFPGTGTVTSADAAQVRGREVTALYEAHALSLTRLAYVMLGDRPAAEDVVQEAFLGLYKRSMSATAWRSTHEPSGTTWPVFGQRDELVGVERPPRCRLVSGG